MANIFGYVRESINEGDGLRAVLFFSGCHGMCKGCHNPESWDFNYGVPFSITLQDKITKEIVNNPLLKGVTYCGGEPFLSVDEIVTFTKRLKKERPELTYWSFTGYKIEDIMKDKHKMKLLKELDVLIDGEFILEKKDLTLKYRGSSNQRIIDVQKTLKAGEVVLRR